MLIRYGARNFFSFKDGLEISFEKGTDKLSNILCVKGANSSGKTNALKAIAFIRDFCCDSWDYKPEDNIPISSFFENDNPTDLYCEFETDDIFYYYEISLNEKEVLSEKLYRKKKRYIPLFERQGNKITKYIDEFKGLGNIILRKNASIICSANQYAIEQIQPIYLFFNKITCNVYKYGRYALSENYHDRSKHYHQNQEIFKIATEIIKKCDPCIKKIRLERREDESGEVFYPVFDHEVAATRSGLVFHEQSSGNKSLYMILPYYLYTIFTGGVLVMDEFDINFHPHILPIFLDLFENKQTNPKNAQLIFTTHNTEIMDRMGKYRTILVNKDKCESYAYRLDEIPGDIIRNDRAIAPIYNSGKIGGIPKI